MRDITRKILLYKLKKRNIKFDDVNLDEVIKAYEFLLNFYLEEYPDKYDHPYSFVFMPNETYDRDNELFYSIFTNTIVLIRLNLLKYLDYAYLIEFHNATNDIDELSGLSWCLRTFIGFHLSEPTNKDFLDKVMHSNRYLIESASTRGVRTFKKMKLVPEDYRMILDEYSQIFNKYDELMKYNDLGKKYERLNDSFLMLMNKTYFYFLKNDLFNKETDKVFIFLNNIKENLESFSDEISLNGITDNDEMMKYIDYLYNKEKDVKEIK